MLSRQAATINGVGLSKDHEDQSRLSYLSSTFWEQTSRNEVIAAREFLWLVATVIDWSHALLLLLTLGKSKVQKLSEYERVILIKYLKEHRISLECSEFKEKATAENLGQLKISVEPRRKCKKRKRNDDADAASAELHSENSNIRDCLRATTSTSNLTRKPCEQVSDAMDPESKLLKELSDSPEVMSLLLLLFSLGGYNIPKSMLVRGCSPRLRWDDTGEVKKITAVDAGLEPDICTFLSNNARLDRALQALALRSFLVSHTLTEGQPTYTLEPHSLRFVTQHISQNQRDKFSTQAWVLACQAFSSGQSLEPLDVSAAKAQSLLLHHVLDYYGFSLYQGLPIHVKTDLAAHLLVTSEFSSEKWKNRAFDFVKKLIDDLPECYLHVWATRLQVRLCSPTNPNQPKCALKMLFPQRNVQAQLSPANPRIYAQYGRFLVSLVEQSLRRNQIPHAMALLFKWKPPNESPSSIMRNATFRWKFAMAKALRLEGSFSKALGLLQQLLVEATDQASFQGIQCRVVSNIADLYCELDKAEAAVDLLRPEMKHHTEGGYEYFANLLRIPLAEALVQQGQFGEAEKHLLQAASFYDRTPELNNIAQTAHVRACFALAKMYTIQRHWEKALARWTEAKDTMAKYAWAQGFTLGMIKFSVAYILANMGHKEKSKEFIQAARNILHREGEHQYWMATVATHWRKFLEGAYQYPCSLCTNTTVTLGG